VPRATALQPLQELLLARGFTERRGLFLRGGDGWQDWVGLNTASHKTPAGVVLVHPVLGVRVDAVEEKLLDLLPNDTSAYRYVTPTVTEPLRYLPTLASAPDHEWYLSEDAHSSASVADEIVLRLDTAGEDYFAQTIATPLADRAALLASINERRIKGRTFALPAISPSMRTASQ